jgi:KDO2-lipid IV(A) lauroyltransferase
VTPSDDTGGHARRVYKRVKNDVLYSLVLAGLALLRRLPSGALRRLGKPLGLLAHLLAVPERRRARRNIQRAVGQRTGLSASPRALTRRVFEHLGQSAVECVALTQRKGRWPEVSFAEKSEAILRSALAEGRGAVFVSGHLGNWELLAAELARIAPLHVLARESYDERLTRLMQRYRQRNGLESLWVGHPGMLRSALALLRQGEMVGVLLDQPVRKGGCMVPFFGRLAPTSTIAAALARATGAALLVGHIRRMSADAHRVSIARLVLDRAGRQRDLLTWTTTLTQRLECAVAERPTEWLWTLDRWRDPVA